MNDIISIFKKDIKNLILNLKDDNIIDDINLKTISIDYSSKSKQGDLSSNIFIILSKKKLNKKIDIEKFLKEYFENLFYIDNIIIAKAGFINIFLKKNFLLSKLKDLFKQADKITLNVKKKKNINIEFVSANPTGPLHVAHIRGAVLGDVLASILESVGHKVTREYYVNDAGSQITNLGNSLFKRYKELLGYKIELNLDEYPGIYLIEIAKEILNIDSDKWINNNELERRKYFEKFAVEYLIDTIKKDLKLIDINFDRFTYENQIVKKNLIENVFNLLKDKNLLYEGILEKPLGDNNQEWEPRKQLLFKSSKFNDDMDRPFQKANGEWTYFANDSAYHYEKFTRGYDKLINIWGADHIGYISRMKSIVDAISNKEKYLDVYICQIVRLIKDEKILKMSKREGNFISLNQIHKIVGKDALRYFMISTKNETPMDFDMNKVIEKNKDNPVFYCQYAYARASSIIRNSMKNTNINNLDQKIDLFDLSLISKYEWEIILKILSWPYVLLQSAENKQPHRITNYLEDLSSSFHSFWNKGKEDISLRMIDENNIKKTISRLIWIECLRIVLKQAFSIIGINAPENM